MNDKKMVIHIGVQKTGSTSLKKLFMRYGVSEKARQLLLKIWMSDGVVFDGGEILNESGIITFEALSSNVRCDRMVMAERVRNYFGNVKILITVRNQHEALVSRYLQGVRHFIAGGKGGFCTFEQYLDDCFLALEKKTKQYVRPVAMVSPLPIYRYYELAEAYSSLFTNVGVFKISQIDDICKFVGIDPTPVGVEYQRISARQYQYAKLKDKFPIISRLKPKWLQGGERANIVCTDQRVTDYYSKSNNLLKKKYGVEFS